MQRAAVIVAGGSGSRMKSELPKQFLPLKGKPVLVHTVQRFLDFSSSLNLALVLPADHKAFWENLAPAHLPAEKLARVTLCTGGSTRSDSVHEGLKQINQHVDQPETCWVAIHDGVRPFTRPELITKAFETAERHGASVACVPVKFSLRRQTSEGESQPVQRSEYFEVQTPQTFRLDKILNCYENRPEGLFTDDASLYQLSGEKVVICEGSYDNIKLTTPEDMAVGLDILNRMSA